MSDFSASKAGSGTEKDRKTERCDKSRRPIFVESPPAHAGIVAALRTAFGEGKRLPDNDELDFAELLGRLN